MTSQLMVEPRNDRAENALGLGWYFSKWAVVLAFYYCLMIGSDYDSIFVTSQSRRQNSNPFQDLKTNRRPQVRFSIIFVRKYSFLVKKGYFYLYCLELEYTWPTVLYLNGRFGPRTLEVLVLYLRAQSYNALIFRN